jgi:hypothetical protein
MKLIYKLALGIASLIFIASCEKDEGKLPNISFKSGGTYIYKDTTLAAGSTFTMGIAATKAEDKDVLKQFTISRSFNGASGVSVYSKSMSGSEEDSYSYDYTTTTDTIAGQKSKYTFTVTNRDGLTNSVSVIVTAQ